MKRIKLGEERYLKVLAYGSPGSTKTRTAASAALDERSSPALMLDVGGNPLSIRDYRETPDIVEITDLNDFNIIYDYLSKGMPETHALAQSGLRTDYKTVIIDGITDTQRLSFAKITGNSAAGPGDMQAPTQIQHHGTVLAQLTTLSRVFYKLPMHVIVTALEHEKQDNEGRLYFRPMLSGQTEGAVGAYAYAIGRFMHKGRIDAKLAKVLADRNITVETSIAFFNPTTRAVAKDQHGFGVPYIVDPTVTKMLDLMEAHERKMKGK